VWVMILIATVSRVEEAFADDRRIKMSQERFAQLLQFFKVIGNESRLKIVGLLANEERSVGELAELLDLKEPTVSHHLSAMKDLGLVGVRAEGTVRIYWLDTKFLEQMSKDLFSRENLATLVDDTSENAWEKKVLQTFVDGDRIKELPSRHKKRLVVLTWLANQLEMDTQYSEKEISERLAHYNPDYASLRRYLVDYGFVKREKGVYWRVN
jgi:DNA-binding transcriptional ArsR family regulator